MSFHAFASWEIRARAHGMFERDKEVIMYEGGAGEYAGEEGAIVKMGFGGVRFVDGFRYPIRANTSKIPSFGRQSTPSASSKRKTSLITVSVSTTFYLSTRACNLVTSFDCLTVIGIPELFYAGHINVKVDGKDYA
nr:hypothetical protein [Tanacetum cinerariifolium]